MAEPRVGRTATVERTFAASEVRQFAALSGDDQARHTEPGEDGRLMVHGLLTATLPTQVGGDHEVLARAMSFEFRRPVYTGETVTCEVTTESVTERADRYEVGSRAVCRNEAGETVMEATYEGVVWKDDDG